MSKAINNRFFYLLLTLTLIIAGLFILNGIGNQPKPIEIQITSENDEQEWNSINSAIKLKPLVNYKEKVFDLTLNYTLSPRKCPSSPQSDLLAIIIVTSYFGHVETRSAMRRAFSHDELRKLKIHRVFLLGQAPTDAYTKQEAVTDENNRFGDIIQGNFIEAYRNLTYKHIMGLKWASENCYSAKYVIKMDDDIVIDLQKIAKLLKHTKLPQSLLAGYILRGMVPKRDPANKWYVTDEEYRYSTYPAFVSGWFYVTTPRIAAKFFLLSHYYDYFWIDDVYVTGILAGNLKIKHFDLGKYFTVYPEFIECCIRDFERLVDCGVMVGPNGGDNNLFYSFNRAAKKCNENSNNFCNKRARSLNETCVAQRKFNLGLGNGIIENYKLH